jgi:uncharacterized protein YunC (DUF1805 family)
MKTGPSIGNILDTAHQHQGGSTQSATRLWLWLGMAAFVLTCGLTAVSQQTIQYTDGYQRTLNVTACGYGFGQCNQGLLSPAEVAQVIAIRHQQNVTACGYGFGQCNQGLLTPAEVAQVMAIRHQQNVTACGYGFGQCNQELLSAAEAAQVMAIRHQQNVTACGYGFGQCNQELLSPAEVARVMAIRRRQETAACEYGAGPCKQTRLIPSDSAVVPSTASAAQCIASSYLPPSIVETSTPAPVSINAEINALLKALLPSVGAPVAENGSYYGEPNQNGVPKTVLVNGYTRSNGTYVQGYYRSAPGTNPIR